MSLTRAAARWILVPLRLVIGYGFLQHGLAKLGRGPEKFGKLLTFIGAPFPAPTAWMVTGLEIIGGVAIIIGAFVLITSIPLIVSMIVAMATIHWHYGFSAVNTIALRPSGPVFGPPGYEVNLLYIGALVALSLADVSALSVDAWRNQRRELRPTGRDEVEPKRR